MVSDLKERAAKELMRRRAATELARRKGATEAAPPSVERDSSFKGTSITVIDPRLNGGKPTNIPDVGDDDADAVADALNSGQEFPSFESVEEAVSAASTAAAPPAPAYGGGAFRAATEGSQASLLGGFDDEITAGMLAPIDAGIDWAKGEGFDIGRAYTRKQQALDAQKAARREEHPVASLGGEIAGGLALGGKAAQSGLTLAGRSLPFVGKTGAAVAEGAAYGGLYGAGEAAPGERLEGAGIGAAIGGVTGGAIERVGRGLANRAARKAMPAAPSSDDVAAQSQALYRASEAEGVQFADAAIKDLGQKLKVAAGDINDKLRPITSGTVDDIDNMLTGPMTLEKFDEFRQGIGLDLKTAKGKDKLILTRMKGMLDDFADNVAPADMTGGPRGVEILKEARKMWQQSKKAEVVENILDSADVKTGQYTQSGFANAIKTEMRALYKAIQGGKAQGWTKEETALIRQMAKGGSSSRLVNLLAKFSPKGVVSILGGQLVGSAVPGVGNVLVPLAGHVAGEAADRSAFQAAQTLRSAAALGSAPRSAKALGATLPNKALPFIAGGVEASTGTARAALGTR